MIALPSNSSNASMIRNIPHLRSRLLKVLGQLESQSNPSVYTRIALAEGEFRIAVLSDTETDEAISRLQRAIRLDPFHPKLFFHLGRLLFTCGDRIGAMLQFRRALRLTPGSHRIHGHLALVLVDGGGEETKLGRSVLDGLVKGQPMTPEDILPALDKVLERHLAAEGDAQGAHDTAGAKPARSQQGCASAQSAAAQAPQTAPRWKAAWRASLVTHLAGPKLVTKHIDRHFEEGASQCREQGSVAEYALAHVLYLLAGEEPGAVRRMLDRPEFADQSGHPAVEVAKASAELLAFETPEEFIEQICAAVEAGRIPVELACLLHFTRAGPTSNLALSRAVGLLDSYPPQILEHEWFRQLRIAVLDGCARRAWDNGRLREARLLWGAAQALDPSSIAVAHNLALLASRKKSDENYYGAWDKAIGLRYAHAAALADPRWGVGDRKVLHLSFVQQVVQRYSASGTKLQDEDLSRWLDDREAVDVWLRHWDLYYLNARLEFLSAPHLLGIPRDANQQVVASGREAVDRLVGRCVDGNRWPGGKCFGELSIKLAESAAEALADPVLRARDPHYAQEKPPAEALSREAIERGFLLHRMTVFLAEKPPAVGLTLASRIGLALLSMPWSLLQPICVVCGMIKQDQDLVAIFENHLAAALVGCARRMISEGQNQDAYTAAVESFALLQAATLERSPSSALQASLHMIDQAALAEIPQELLQPKTLEDAKKAIDFGLDVLDHYPKATGLRKFITDLMFNVGDAAQREAGLELLRAGIEGALSEEQGNELEKQLSRAEMIVRYYNELEGVNKRVEKALAPLQLAGATRDDLRRAHTVLSEAMQEVERVLAEARRKKELEQVAKQAEALLASLRQIEDQLRQA